MDQLPCPTVHTSPAKPAPNETVKWPSGPSQDTGFVCAGDSPTFREPFLDWRMWLNYVLVVQLSQGRLEEVV